MSLMLICCPLSKTYLVVNLHRWLDSAYKNKTKKEESSPIGDLLFQWIVRLKQLNKPILDRKLY